jgi:hypothetical protein
MSPLSPAATRFWEGVGYVLSRALGYSVFLACVSAPPSPAVLALLIGLLILKAVRRA